MPALQIMAFPLESGSSSDGVFGDLLKQLPDGIFTTDLDGAIVHWLGRSETYFPMIERIMAEEGAPDELKYLAMVESALNPRARSHAAAAIDAMFRAGSRGTRSASRPVTSATRAGPSVSSTVTRSPIPSTARPRTSNPGPTFPMHIDFAGTTEIDTLTEKLAEAAAELEDLGVEFKGIDLGLVDFPTMMDGELAYLCWSYGEDRIGFWHSPDGGYAGRRPLERD